MSACRHRLFLYRRTKIYNQTPSVIIPARAKREMSEVYAYPLALFAWALQALDNRKKKEGLIELDSPNAGDIFPDLGCVCSLKLAQLRVPLDLEEDLLPSRRDDLKDPHRHRITSCPRQRHRKIRHGRRRVCHSRERQWSKISRGDRFRTVEREHRVQDEGQNNSSQSQHIARTPMH